MKDIINFISEKFTINSKTVIGKSPDNWNIKDAENGDFCKWKNNIYFIFKCFNTKHKYSDLSENSIVYYLTYNKKTDLLRNKIGCGVGYIDNEDGYSLLNDDEKEEFIKILKGKGFKWDENKNELIKS